LLHRVARVFLSHAGPDKPAVRRIATALRAAGHDTWLDEEDILVGESIPAAVERGLRDADFVVLCLSRAAAERGWVEAERDATLMQQFRERKERILPVRLEEVTPPGLVRPLAHVDLFPDEQAFNRGIARLTRSIAAYTARYATKGDVAAVSSSSVAVSTAAAAVGGSMGRKVASPTPAYLSAEDQALSEQLERARERRQNLRDAGIATDEVDREILGMRRQLREGGQLRAGDALGHGRYLLVRPVGRGGFAVVWEAFDRAEQRRVAIKVLHQHLASESQRRERFFRGARVMMDLKHPAVVRVYDPRGEDEAFRYFVMELVPGGNLRDAVLGQRVAGGHRLALILQVGEALAEAHRKRLVHRDIKPANILLDEHGSAKLTDFDLVGASDTTGGTRTGALGTVVYAAPECLDKPQEATARADVFGLGMTAIFCLSGQELSMATFRNPAATVARLDCSVPVQNVLERAVAWEPAERFADAAAMVGALHDALDGSSQSAAAGAGGAVTTPARGGEPERPPVALPADLPSDASGAAVRAPRKQIRALSDDIAATAPNAAPTPERPSNLPSAPNGEEDTDVDVPTRTFQVHDRTDEPIVFDRKPPARLVRDESTRQTASAGAELRADLEVREFQVGEGPRPEIKSPDERHGDVARVPLFPSRALSTARAVSAPEPMASAFAEVSRASLPIAAARGAPSRGHPGSGTPRTEGSPLSSSRGGMWVVIMVLFVMGAATTMVYLFVLRSGPVGDQQVARPAINVGIPTIPTPDAAAVVARLLAAPDAAAVEPSPLADPRSELAADVEPRLRTAALALDGKSDAASQALRAQLIAQLAQDLLDRAGLVARPDADNLRKESRQLVLDAATAAQRALRADPQHPGANLAMAAVLRLQGKPARDIKRYLDTAQGSQDCQPPDKINPYEKACNGHVCKPCPSSEQGWSVDLALADALVLARDGQIEKARAAFAAIDQGDGKLETSGDVRARFHLALALAAQGKAAEARPLVDAILAAQPEHTGARALVGRLETLVGGADSYDRLIQRAKAISDGNCTKTMDLYAQASELNPNGVEALVGLGYCQIDAKQFSSAFSKFRAALVVSPKYEPALRGIAETYTQQGRTEQAIHAYRHYLEVYPDNVAAKKQLERLEAYEDPMSSPHPPR
jgi:serine/threonine-protein kinase